MDNDNYFYEQLKTGRSIKVLFIGHNSYCASFSVSVNKYNNCIVDTFTTMSTYDKRRARGYDDYDLIILYSSNDYNDFDFNRISSLAKKISIEKNKKVSIGYSYIIPMQKRENPDITDGIVIATFNEEKIEKHEDIKTDELTIYKLASMLLQEHDKKTNHNLSEEIQKMQKVASKNTREKQLIHYTNRQDYIKKKMDEIAKEEYKSETAMLNEYMKETFPDDTEQFDMILGSKFEDDNNLRHTNNISAKKTIKNKDK